MQHLLNEIMNSVWMISPDHVSGFLPSVARLMQGKQSSFFQREAIKPYSINAQAGRGSSKPTQNKVVGVVPIRGVLMKDDQECGPAGMETLHAYTRQLAEDPTVSSIIFDVDSPGGQACYLELFGNYIESIEKPTAVYYNHLNCSAAYYLSCKSDYVFASSSTDIVGSIGTMTTAVDVIPSLKKQGIKVEEIYADQSTDKNGLYREALNGNYEPIKTQLLNPLAEDFINVVKSGREGIDESVFTGKTYLSDEAEKLGLIDGQKTIEEVAAFLSEKATPTASSSNTNTTQNTMKYEAILNVLGFSELVLQDGHASFSAEHLNALNAALANNKPAEEAPVFNLVEAPEFKQLKGLVEAQATTIAEQKAQIKTLEGRFDTMEGQPGAAAAAASADAGEASEGDDDFENKYQSMNSQIDIDIAENS